MTDTTNIPAAEPQDYVHEFLTEHAVKDEIDALYARIRELEELRFTLPPRFSPKEWFEDLRSTPAHGVRQDPFGPLRGLNTAALEDDPSYWARPGQLEFAHSETPVTIVVGGRGHGKTRALALAIANHLDADPHASAVVAVAYHNRIQNLVDEIIASSPNGSKASYTSVYRKLVWGNGAKAVFFDGRRPDALRGHRGTKAFTDNVEDVWDDAVSGGNTVLAQFPLNLVQSDQRQIFGTTDRETVPKVEKILYKYGYKPADVRFLYI